MRSAGGGSWKTNNGGATWTPLFDTQSTVQSFEVTSADNGREFVFRLPKVDGAKYLRIRGTDGNRSAPGLMGAAVDPQGPAADVLGDADPWKDLWFYTNPIWVLPSR